MKLRLASILAIILALCIVSGGFAHAQLLACRYQCAQERQDTLAPCCRSGAGSHHATVAQQAETDAGCPHVDGRSNFADISATSPATKIATPSASSPVGTFTADSLPPAAIVSSTTFCTGASPPGIPTPPLYHLYCSLLI